MVRGDTTTTARALIEKTHRDLIVNYPIQEDPSLDFITQLYSLLEERNETEFNLSIENNSSFDVVNATNGKSTLLQRAVAQKLLLATGKLLERGTDALPVFLAVDSGDVEIFNLLLEHKDTDFSVLTDDHKSTILHRVVLSPHPTATRCLELILRYAIDKKKLGRRAVDINVQDFRKYTALHYAAKTNNQGHVNLLLGIKEVNIFIYDDQKTPAFFYINPKYIINYLNLHIRNGDENIKNNAHTIKNGENATDKTHAINKEKDKDNKHVLVFDYNFLVVPRVAAPVEKKEDVSTTNAAYLSVPTESEDPGGEIHEMEPLMLLADSPNHRSLLTHPVFRSFLHLKWLRVYWLFYANFLLYSLFTVFLSLHVYSLVSTEAGDTNCTNSTTGTEFKSEQEAPKIVKDSMFWGPTLVLLIWLVIRELSQMFMNFTQYVWQLENWLEMALICLTGALLAPLDSNLVDKLSSCAVLLAYTELMLLIGRHPSSLATYITMFFRVSRTFFCFLLWYSLLVVSFGFSFYIIFRHCINNKEDKKNIFSQMITSLFKTVVMLSGELDAGDLHFDTVSVISHIIFLLYLFFIVIVLMNLLNGLAVSDTQAIRDEAQVVCCVAQVKLFDKIENTWFGLKNWLNGMCYYSKYCKGKIKASTGTILLLSGRLPKKELRVFLNRDNRMAPDVKYDCQRGLASFVTGGTCCPRNTCVRKLCRLCMVFNTIVSDACAVVRHQNQESETQQMLKRIEGIETNIIEAIQKASETQQLLRRTESLEANIQAILRALNVEQTKP